jgi:ribosomal protein S18 acetylase RimI-like enzyme
MVGEKDCSGESRSWEGKSVITTRPIGVDDATVGGPAEVLIAAVLGDRHQVRLGEAVDVLALPGFAATDSTDGGRLVGVATWSAERGELVCLCVAADVRRRGIGTMLVEAVLATARHAGLERLWLATTNDNVDALALYQRCGFRITRVMVGGVDQARQLKPSIPLIGARGIPIHDEMVLEAALR